MSIVVSDISYHFLNQHLLFEQVSFTVARNRKVSLIGNNGTGKSTLLKLLAGELVPSSGSIHCSSQPYYIPQQIGVTGQRISESLGVHKKINALNAIIGGSCDIEYYDQLAEDWEIESRCRSSLDFWGLSNIDLNDSTDLLSGGEKTKVFLAGLLIHTPPIILLDEPTNHLDLSSRKGLYEYIKNCKATVLVVSHDITLLDQLEATYELSARGISLDVGNFSFYQEQKRIEDHALAQKINSEEISLKLAQKRAQEVRERQEKRSHQAQRNKKQAGVACIIMNARGNLAENSAAKLKEKHSDIIFESKQNLVELRNQKRLDCNLKIDFEDAQIHLDKLLISALEVNWGYNPNILLWQTPLNVEIRSGERVHIKGDNGCGKTTLIKLLIGDLYPTIGEIKRSDFSSIYIDQHYNQVNKDITVIELANSYNKTNLWDHEIKLRLNRALFPQDTWDKCCLNLSGGERMRLYLCCPMISNQIPDLFILDEPTNNLDLSSLQILTRTIKNYRGTLLVISHDQSFIKEINMSRAIEL